LDPVHYPEHKVKQFVNELHSNKQKYMMIVDPGVKIENGYKMYEEGLKEKLYITKEDGVTPIVNK
jgi:alpha-glucosidase (family GH31 glycosyl hydrolase)